MDASERLSADALARHDYLTASHLHRYGVAAELCAGLRVVDLGCGIGYGTALLAERAQGVVGVDVDDGAVRTARREHGGDFVQADAATFLRGLAPGDHDAVVLLEVLEHLSD